MGTIASYYEARTADAGAGDTVEITQNPEKNALPKPEGGMPERQRTQTESFKETSWRTRLEP